MRKFSSVTIISIVLGLVISSLISVSAFADSNEADYWSVGAFSTAENAMIEKARLAGMTDQPIQIAVFAEGEMALFRLVIRKDSDPKKQKEMLLKAGLTPWSIAFDHDRLLDPEAMSVLSDHNFEYFLVLGGVRNLDEAVTTLDPALEVADHSVLADFFTLRVSSEEDDLYCRI